MDKSDSMLIKRLENLVANNPSYWDFKEAKKEHIHGICSYPATMVPEMQAEVLRFIKEINPGINSILDPFMGSGTVLVEGMLNNLEIYGIDINPLSYLLSDFKINLPYVKEIKKSKKVVFNFLNSNKEYTICEFKNIDKWFREDIKDGLSKIKAAIVNVKLLEVRRFYWISFAETIRICNNSQNSTFKLHIKKAEDIEKFAVDVIECFKKIVDSNIKAIEKYILLNKNLSYKDGDIIYDYNKKRKVYLGNSIERLKSDFKKESVDLIITSPPYGDNQTTVTYGQFSILPLRWIPKEEISDHFDEELLKFDNRIDSESLGGVRYKLDKIEESNILEISNSLNNIYNKLLNEQEEEKARKVASFIMDFNEIFKELIRVLSPNGYMVFTVGNRRVSGKEIAFNSMVKELSEFYNLEVIYEFDRNILGKRIPSKVSRLKSNVAVKSMSKEYIIILKKRDKIIK